jgi:hypothetical protein
MAGPGERRVGLKIVVDLFLRAFQTMVHAEDGPALLDAVFRDQLWGPLDGAPPLLEQMLHRAMGTADPGTLGGSLGAASAVLERIRKQFEAEVSPAGTLMRVLLTVDRAACHMVGYQREIANRLVMEAVQDSARSRSFPALQLAIDIGWPISWYRFRKDSVWFPEEVAQAATYDKLQASARDPEVAQLFRFASTVFEPWTLLRPVRWGTSAIRHPEFLRDARHWASRVDRMHNRWNFAALIAATPPDPSAIAPSS